MDRENTLKQLTMLDFMATDLALYLDSHPHDKIAIEEYNKIVGEADIIRQKYEHLYGPLCSYRSHCNGDWKWIDDPWTWEEEFNFTASKEAFK